VTCIIGRYCHKHRCEHGGEAEELRARLEQLNIPAVNRLLDDVDARDSLAYVEICARREAADRRAQARAAERRAYKATMDGRR
jgi:hypothetical protein